MQKISDVGLYRLWAMRDGPRAIAASLLAINQVPVGSVRQQLAAQ